MLRTTEIPGERNNTLRVAAEQFKLLAEKCARQNSPGKAFMYYCLVLQLKPEWLQSLKSSFSTALCEWGKILEHEEKYDDLFRCYEKALELYPDNELILNNLGAHLCRLQQPREALYYFKKAIEVNNDYLPAYVNAQITKSLLVERWHFRMLNDSVRNESYREAIAERVSRGCKSILDIGSGTGLLSMFAKRSGAVSVYACDYSETMISISKRVLEANGLSDAIHVINKLSTCLSIPDDIPERVSLVVTETFDAGLLGEHILETLIHAWENLLEPVDAGIPTRVIPSGASLYIAPIESVQIAQKNYILKSNRISRSSFENGFNLSGLCISSSTDEPYDTENLKSIRYSFLSKPQKLFDFDFNNASELKKYYDGEIIKKLEFPFLKEGYVDAFAVWFDLILSDEKVITSFPLGETRCCWEHAIFPLKDEFLANEHKTFTLQATCENGFLSINSSVNVLANRNDEHTVVPQLIVSLLNCDSLLNTLVQALQEIKNSFGHKLISVLDLSTCPYLGMLIAREMNSKVLLSNQANELLSGNKKLLDSLNVYSSKVMQKDWCDIELLLKDKSTAFDIVIVDILETTGQTNEETVGLMPLISELLVPDGLALPSKVHIWCQMVYSEDLLEISEVRSSQDKLHIAEYINEYKVTHMIDFNLHDIKYEEMCESFLIASLDVRNSSCEMVFTKEIEISQSGKANALIYWYHSEYFCDVYFNSLSPDSHINHAAALMDTPLFLTAKTVLQIKLQYNSGGMRFSVIK